MRKGLRPSGGGGVAASSAAATAVVLFSHRRRLVCRPPARGARLAGGSPSIAWRPAVSVARARERGGVVADHGDKPARGAVPPPSGGPATVQ